MGAQWGVIPRHYKVHKAFLGPVFTCFDHQPIKLVKFRDAVQLVSQCMWGGCGWCINSSRVRAMVGE